MARLLPNDVRHLREAIRIADIRGGSDDGAPHLSRDKRQGDLPMTDLTTEAVEAAARALEPEFGAPTRARQVVEAVYPLIAAQATADLRAGIEALAGEMRADIARYLSTRGARITGETLAHYAAALDALLGGA